ncbi:hypothetical protein MBM_00360 [Drepanopeziza brunnea f. sp. 'multigermtubi' MB_m1]|uniref:Uncharacterized protein n=1 Tax=Marssonina brunnea f. sp. multigermtubi (strain MB_m1) TaxID=1072389 RepID=K1X860_MARBU|nr:uncharacterized protein MBM_00360 [Drepanopeziza brunnea f. sp. 'multigermtubi' MB_m1]EKD21247.1 hypothetical protein MBM_00360 [Drepanopeziza brunnea f. sp. 'multigermtubi' MB_m1]
MSSTIETFRVPPARRNMQSNCCPFEAVSDHQAPRVESASDEEQLYETGPGTTTEKPRGRPKNKDAQDGASCSTPLPTSPPSSSSAASLTEEAEGRKLLHDSTERVASVKSFCDSADHPDITKRLAQENTHEDHRELIEVADAGRVAAEELLLCSISAFEQVPCTQSGCPGRGPGVIGEGCGNSAGHQQRAFECRDRTRRVGLPLQAYERVVEECGAGRTVSTITEAWDNNKEEEGNDDGFGAGDGARMVQYLKIKRWREKDIEIAQLKMKLEAMSLQAANLVQKKPPKWLNTFGLSTSAILYSIMSLKKLPRGLKLFDNLIRFATRGLPFVPLKKI